MLRLSAGEPRGLTIDYAGQNISLSSLHGRLEKSADLKTWNSNGIERSITIGDEPDRGFARQNLEILGEN